MNRIKEQNRLRVGFVAIAASVIVATTGLYVMTSSAAMAATGGFGTPTPVEISATGWVYGYFNGVSCTSATNCTAVGYGDFGGMATPFYATKSGGSWGSVNEISGNELLQGVSCTSATNCTAVGYSSGPQCGCGPGSPGPAYATESGGIWGPMTTIGPASDVVLNGVSCTSATNCTAVGGSYYATESDGNWSALTQVPAFIGDQTNITLSSVSCTSATDCTAVGWDNNLQPSFLTESDGAWGTPTEISGLAGGNGALLSVSCTSATDCTAVGYYVTVNGNGAYDQSFYATESGGTWGSATDISFGGDGSLNLNSVSCTSATNCTAVGAGALYGYPEDAPYEPYYVTESAGTWGSATEIPGSPGGTRLSGGVNGSLNGVSCTSATNCTAVGYDGNSLPMYVLSQNSTPGGTTTVSKSAGLIGHYSDKVSGAGWAVSGDTSVTLNECATTYYNASSCDAANQVTGVALGTGHKLGKFSAAPITLAAGIIDANDDTCGLATSNPCYIVVVGNTGDSTSSAALDFKPPSATVKKTTAVVANYVDKVTAAEFPSGDIVTAQECDSAVNPATNLATNCDTATEITGTVHANGKVIFSPTGVGVKVGSSYVESGSGTVVAGGAADIVVNDSTTSGISVVVPITLAP